MKRILLLLIFFSTQLLFAQSFEGKLTYIVDFEVSEKMAKMGLSKQMLRDKMKEDGSWSDTIKVFYKQGNYYTLLKTKPKTWNIYKADVNKIYSMQDGDASDICSVTNASIDLESTITGKMPIISKVDTTVNVNGTPCSLVLVKWKSGTYRYYYNTTKLNVNPDLFSKHVYDGWAEFLKISNALPMKIEKSVGGMMTVTMALSSFKAEAVDEALFLIPKLAPDSDLNMIKLANVEMMRIIKE